MLDRRGKLGPQANLEMKVQMWNGRQLCTYMLTCIHLYKCSILIDTCAHKHQSSINRYICNTYVFKISLFTDTL
jgi:hypothetical protein